MAEVTDVRAVNESVERIRSFYNTLCGQFLARNEVLRLMITATVAQEPLLFVGRPGTAKSLLVSVFCQGLRLAESEYFEYMLTKFTEPGEATSPAPSTLPSGCSAIARPSTASPLKAARATPPSPNVASRAPLAS